MYGKVGVRDVIASEAKQSLRDRSHVKRLLRRCAPRNDIGNGKKLAELNIEVTQCL